MADNERACLIYKHLPQRTKTAQDIPGGSGLCCCGLASDPGGRDDISSLAPARLVSNSCHSARHYRLPYRNNSRLGTPESYYFEASIHALWGNRQEALATLRKAIDLGWRRHWYAKLDPTLELLRDTPEFKEMMAEVEADIARQRERLKQEGLLLT